MVSQPATFVILYSEDDLNPYSRLASVNSFWLDRAPEFRIRGDSYRLAVGAQKTNISVLGRSKTTVGRSVCFRPLLEGLSYEKFRVGVVGEAAPALAIGVAETRCALHKSAAGAQVKVPLLETVMIKIPALQPPLSAFRLVQGAGATGRACPSVCSCSVMRADC